MARLMEERCKVQTFLDEKDIEGGESIPDKIRRSIKECNEFIVLLSPNSIERPWVLIEIGAAWVLEKKTIAIVNNVTPEGLPDIIRFHKAIDLNDFNSKYLEELGRRVKKMGD